MSDLTALHVIPLLPGHEQELAADARHLLESGVCTAVACMFTLVPEADPPVDKVAVLAERYRSFMRAFEGDPAHVGVLVQATIGHGWTPDEPAPFQKIIRPDGMPAYQKCPLDRAFQRYIDNALRGVTALNPAFIMIDDDFRLLTGRNGCYCPLHLAECARRLGQAVTRESLCALLQSDISAARLYDDLLLDTLMQLAGVIRGAIDSVDPSIPVSFCACYGDIRHAVPIARRLAAAGQRPVIRINNARYLTAEMRSFPVRMYHGAAQIAGLSDDVTVLAETDTCPHNRYSTSAALLHAHYTGSILEGCDGAKHWLTRLGQWQPASGAAYRATLMRHQGFYEALYRAVRETSPAAYIAAALPAEPFFNRALDQGDRCGSAKTWAALLGVMGLPCNYARLPDLPSLLTGDDVELFPDADLHHLLSQGAILEGAAAEALCQRGFADDIGVMAEPWTGPHVSAEIWQGRLLGADARYTRLTPIDTSTSVYSNLLHSASGVSTDYTVIGPAVTRYINAHGGRIAVYAASFGPNTALSSFGFYDEDRKRQLLDLLGYVCGAPVPVYYPGDAEVYLKLRRYSDGRYLTALFNLGHDLLDTVPFDVAFAVSGAEWLSAEGDWQPVDWRDGAVQAPLHPAQPVIYRLTPSG